MARIFSLYGSIFIDNEKANKSIDDTTKKGESFSSKLGGAFSKVGKGALALGGTVATAAATIGSLAINTQKNVDQAMNNFAAQTGTAKEHLGEYQKVLEGIYKNNYGENFEDIAKAMATVQQQFVDLDNVQLQNITESAFALRDAFDIDINESVRAAQAMMKNFGITADEAFNLIAQGTQSGLDFSGEFIDNINEYSVQFGKLGLSAEDMFNIFQSGSDAGAWNLDKIGDAVKEFSIRAIDGSNTTIEGFTKLGMNADEMAKKFAAGGDTAKNAFYQTIEAIKNMDDPVQQSIVGVDLFGTMWEDLGPEVVTQLGSIKDMYDGTVDSMQQIKDVKYDDVGSMMEGLKRNVEMLLLPLGNSLMPIINQVLNFLLDNMPLIESTISSITPIITQLFESLLPPLMNMVETILPIFSDLIEFLLPPLIQIIEMVLPLLLSLIEPLLGLLQPIMGILQPLIDIVMAILDPLIQILNIILPPLITVITTLINIALKPLQTGLKLVANIVKNVFSAAFSALKPVLESLKTYLGGIIKFITGVFSGNWKKAWQGIKDIFKGIISGFGNLFKAPINYIIGLINGFIKGINKVKIPDWVPKVGGKGINIPLIKKLRVGMEYVPYDDMPALLHKGERVLTAEEAKEYKRFEQKAVTNNETTNNWNLTINSTEPLSPAETARKTRKAIQELNLKYGKV